MSRKVEETTAWVYEGAWRILSAWFCVPRDPPALPGGSGGNIRTFRPSSGFLRYLKLQFWLVLLLADAALGVAWLFFTGFHPSIGLAAAPLVVTLMILPGIVAFVAIHLRYDTTWYVLTDRSLRIRSGIWVIHETTITFENVQNVTLESGPLERWFGIANLTLDTAGGAGASSDSEGTAKTNYHKGRIEGVDNAVEIRNLIMKQVRGSRAAGIGDEQTLSPGFSSDHITALKEIRDALSNASRPQ